MLRKKKEERRTGWRAARNPDDGDDFDERNLRGLLCRAGVIIREIGSESLLAVVEDGDHVVGEEEGDVEDGEHMGDQENTAFEGDFEGGN